MFNINNMPAHTERFIVARRNDKRELWFWGSWDDRNTANEVALEIGGITFDTQDNDD